MVPILIFSSFGWREGIRPCEKIDAINLSDCDICTKTHLVKKDQDKCFTYLTGDVLEFFDRKLNSVKYNMNQNK